MVTFVRNFVFNGIIKFIFTLTVLIGQFFADSNEKIPSLIDNVKLNTGLIWTISKRGFLSVHQQSRVLKIEIKYIM